VGQVTPHQRVTVKSAIQYAVEQDGTFYILDEDNLNFKV
jgi:hypothetical protein